MKFHQVPELVKALDEITLNQFHANWIRRPKEFQRIIVESEKNYKKTRRINTLVHIPIDQILANEWLSPFSFSMKHF